MNWILILFTILAIICIVGMIFSHYCRSVDVLLRIRIYEKSFFALLIVICFGFVAIGGLWPVDKEVEQLHNFEICRTSDILFIEHEDFTREITRAKLYNARNEDLYIKKEIYYNSYGIDYARSFKIKTR